MHVHVFGCFKAHPCEHLSLKQSLHALLASLPWQGHVSTILMTMRLEVS